MFKKIILLLIVICVGFSASLVYAQEGGTEFVELVNPVGENDIWGIIGRIINVLFLACIYGGLIVIIWAGWSMITSQGDSGKVKKATQMITWVIVGIVVVLLARAIIGFTYYIVTGKRGGVPNLNGTTNNAPNNNQPYIAPEENTVPDLNLNTFKYSQ